MAYWNSRNHDAEDRNNVYFNSDVNFSNSTPTSASSAHNDNQRLFVQDGAISNNMDSYRNDRGTVNSNTNRNTYSYVKSNPPDITHSNLTATAPEFRPSRGYNSDKKHGAVRKHSSYKDQRGYRTDNSERSSRTFDYRNPAEKSEDWGQYRNEYYNSKYSRDSKSDEPIFSRTFDSKRPEKTEERGQYNDYYNSKHGRDGKSDEQKSLRMYEKSEERGQYNSENYNSKYGRDSKSDEQKKILQETAKFLKNVNQSDKASKREFDNYQHKNKSNQNSFYSRNQKQFSKVNKGDASKRNETNSSKESHDSQGDKLEKQSHEKRNALKLNLTEKLNAASQRERLEQLITRRLLECLVCCEKIRHADAVWSCKQCYHILHLTCTIQWAQSSKLESGWRCPACQNVCADVPKDYYCYCDTVVKPPLEMGTIPHGCGELCKRKGRFCSHTCTLLCHPGPCPECNIMVPRVCGCGVSKVIVKCSSDVPITCKNVCSKLLSCGSHSCNKICHKGECGSCTEFVIQECYCGKVGRKVQCTEESAAVTHYNCDDICGRSLKCGNHNCSLKCHSGSCKECEKAPTLIKSCPCGKSPLRVERKSCLDPIPCCEQICMKPLKCGQPSSPHLCKQKCHDGPCSVCTLSTLVRCRCGHMDRELPCTELTTKADDARCEKKCAKKRACGKHKCNQLCCIDIDHLCNLLCNRMLSCGQHRCEENCHRGRCPPCWRSSFEELYCECRSNVIFPPVACGTRPPLCNEPCSRPRPCGHEVLHTCHIGPCPPCAVLSKRWCHGHHEQRSTILCYQLTFSCGFQCGKDLECANHKCIQPCHEGTCISPCTQPCSKPRTTCGHPCNQPCHKGPCPDSSCKQIVKVTCQCGLRSTSRTCVDLSGEYNSIAMSQLASKMEEMQKGHSVDLTDLVTGSRKPGSFKTLECNDECRLIERNRRLAIGLQIRNPDLSAKLTPRFSDYMKSWAKKDSRFCQYVHDKLTELVQLAKQSKQKSRSYSFETMNREKRHFVHEYCEHFGCESAAYDPEPNRNVVATSYRDKSWLPSISLLEFILRENGQRKVPGPVISKGTPSRSDSTALPLPGGRVQRPPTPPGEYVDYFNDPPM